MLRNAIVAGLVIGTSASVPLIYQAYPEAIAALTQTKTSEMDPPARAMAVSAPAPSQSTSGRKFMIDVDSSGHFFGSFKLNGRKVEALIDTGASAVAINLSTARKLGMNIQTSDMKNTVNTANGKARATLAMIGRVEVGRILVENVQAVVLEDEALSTTLIGMTFLNRLKAFKVDDGTLTLVQ